MARFNTVFFGAGVRSSHRLSYCLIAMLLLVLPVAQCQLEKLYVDETDINLLVDETHLFKLIQIGEYNTTLQVTSQIQHPDIVQFVPPVIDMPGVDKPDPTTKHTYDICAYGKSPGHSEVTFNVTPPDFVNLDTVFLRVTVMHSNAIYIISYIMGWIYFAAWSVSFYPQIYINFKRKSVVGLNFDFLALNIMGFTMYSLFNCGLYFSKEIQSEYFTRHPRSLNPVQLNDVFFSLHASFATLVTITQCFLYERDNQRVSMTARGILSAFVSVVIITASLGAASKVAWLDFLYYCSYIKLCITLIKYVPQAYMNYKRKSTVGWSIGNIFLDSIGGSLSILQMTLNAYNYNDWISFFGDATKFGLGLFSLVFDIFFMLQHYVFYREGKRFMIVDGSEEGSSMMSSGVGSEYFLVRTWDADEKKYDLEAKA
ncbi:cystinosin homolog isoform X1 [Nymphalis io]|uniref:cystinosin homolog isoform X1 n=1 Tax=Inachis io TaxID=171585 RepID=UPI00216783B5|nr:cystinosin homolog isoform X1 [Nymphalis io]XP_050342861.1 cystinosin homolog isoform X1 [Nymphalis io]XP_050342862.1 cystinosin homolog isoform X1 [Nymphalis io]XP_050342864.1 cystinosin homolog isoform X1 [Nymphalis io]XP_050342865.1 cystinosin homolog isoform X1 [Nymphalis io]